MFQLNKYLRFEVYTAMLIRMPSSGLWRRVNILLTDVSEECIASIFRE
jgi:hypothetical protein